MTMTWRGEEVEQDTQRKEVGFLKILQKRGGKLCGYVLKTFCIICQKLKW